MGEPRCIWSVIWSYELQYMHLLSKMRAFKTKDSRENEVSTVFLWENKIQDWNEKDPNLYLIKRNLELIVVMLMFWSSIQEHDSLGHGISIQ